MFFGAALIVLTFAFPGGFVAGARQIKARLVTIMPSPPWLADHVSLPPFVPERPFVLERPLVVEPPDDRIFRRPGPAVATDADSDPDRRPRGTGHRPRRDVAPPELGGF